MAFVDRYDAAFGIFIQRQLRNVHTNIRGKITEVDYGASTVSVQPTAYTEYASGTIDKFPNIHDVPLQLPTGNGGKARLTMPVKPGDMVGLAFSERNEDDNTDEATHELWGGWATTHGMGTGRPIDPDNVVLENDKAIITLKPSGDMSLVNPVVTIESLANGNFKISNGPGTVILDPSGGLTVNGAKITPAGRMITAQGVDLDDFFNEYRAHFHRGVERGDSQTDGPSHL